MIFYFQGALLEIWPRPVKVACLQSLDPKTFKENASKVIKTLKLTKKEISKVIKLKIKSNPTQVKNSTLKLILKIVIPTVFLPTLIYIHPHSHSHKITRLMSLIKVYSQILKHLKQTTPAPPGNILWEPRYVAETRQSRNREKPAVNSSSVKNSWKQQYSCPGIPDPQDKDSLANIQVEVWGKKLLHVHQIPVSRGRGRYHVSKCSHQGLDHHLIRGELVSQHDQLRKAGVPSLASQDGDNRTTMGTTSLEWESHTSDLSDLCFDCFDDLRKNDMMIACMHGYIPIFRVLFSSHTGQLTVWELNFCVK